MLGEHLSRPADVFLDVGHAVAWIICVVGTRAVEVLTPNADAVDQIGEFTTVGSNRAVKGARFISEVGVPLTGEEAKEEGGVGSDGVLDRRDGTSGRGVYHCVEASGFEGAVCVG